MAIEIPTVISVLRSLIQVGMAARDAWKDEGFGTSELSVLTSAFGVGEGIWKLKAKRDEDAEVGALHLAFVTRCFGHAIGRYQAYSELFTSKQRALFENVAEPVQNSELTQKQIERLLEGAAKVYIAPGYMPVGRLEFDLVESLTDSPLVTPYYRFLWEAFFNPSTSESPLLNLEAGGRLEFERYFLIAWGQAMASPIGGRLRQYLDGLGRDYKSLLLRDLLVGDMAGWSDRHTFGNLKREDAREGDPLPFMPLEKMYVEPSASEVGKLGASAMPVLGLLEGLLQEHNVVIVQADFGMGKSLSARMLACRMARKFRSASESSLDLALPVHVRCVDDLKAQDLAPRVVVKRAYKRHADALGYSLKMDDQALGFPSDKQRALFLIDGLDEVHLGESGLESFFERIKDEATDKHRFVIFSRPGAIPSRKELRALKDVPVLELLPWSKVQVDDWLNRWAQVREGRGPTGDEIENQGLDELARTPILLLMIAHTWNPEERGKTVSSAELYERFFQSIARGKHEADQDEHPAIFHASKHMRGRLLEKGFLIPEATEPDAMLWLMSRVAWEEVRLRQRDEEEALDKYQIERILREELDLKGNAPDVIGAIQVGLLLTLQANLQSGRAGPILFGHKSFREFLVARYWADRLRALAMEKDRRDVVEKSLVGGRLLGREDKSFAFLMEMLNTEPARRRYPGQPFGLSDLERDKLLRWAEDCFQDESWKGRESSSAGLRDDMSPWLREAALAIGSHLRGAQGIGQRDTGTVRSLYAWFWFVETHPFIKAPRARLPGASMSGMVLTEADLREANLREANLSDSSCYEANFGEADFSDADLSGASFFRADLAGANFNDANLSGVHFRYVNLRGVSLCDALLDGAFLSENDFQGADINGADLRRANLYKANLARADLREANLGEATLQESYLIKADLRGANLRKANLAGADLTEANLAGTDLAGVDFTGANLTGANLQYARYDRDTLWGDFNATASGAVLEKGSGEDE